MTTILDELHRALYNIDPQVTAMALFVLMGLITATIATKSRALGITPAQHIKMLATSGVTMVAAFMTALPLMAYGSEWKQFNWIDLNAPTPELWAVTPYIANATVLVMSSFVLVTFRALRRRMTTAAQRSVLYVGGLALFLATVSVAAGSWQFVSSIEHHVAWNTLDSAWLYSRDLAVLMAISFVVLAIVAIIQSLKRRQEIKKRAELATR